VRRTDAKKCPRKTRKTRKKDGTEGRDVSGVRMGAGVTGKSE